MTRNEVAVPETRQVNGAPEGLCPRLDGAPVAGEGATRTTDSGAYDADLGGSVFLRWGRACVAALERARAEIDGLNVFPVPDSDTGRNLLATMRAAVLEAEAAAAEAAADPAGADMDSVAEAAGGIAGGPVDRACRPVEQVHPYAAAMARGATSGARGNSGIILSQVLRGIAECTVDRGLTGETYRDGLARAAELVRNSLSEPVEGTILTVLARASDAARECAGSELAQVARAAAEGAARALEQTRDQLAVLRAAGVVDAGARGLLVLLDTMVAVVTGETPVRGEYPPAAETSSAGRGQAVPEPVRYEVMFRIAEADDRRAAELRSRLAQLGDSVVVAADGAGGWTTHVHCAEAGAAVEAGIAAGAVRDIRIEYLAESRAPAGRPGHMAAGPEGRCVAGQTTSGGTNSDSGSAEHSVSDSVVVAPPTDGAEAETAGCDAHAGIGGAGTGGRAVQAGSAGQDAAGRGVQADVAAAGPGCDGARPDAAAPDAAGGVRADNADAAGMNRGPRSAASRMAIDRGVLAVAAGAGATGLFEAAGAVVLDAEPALESAALLAAIREMPHREVLVLPNGALPAHELVAIGVAARDAHRDVLLLPSASMVQGLAAMAVHDRARIAVDDAFAMSEAAASTRWGALRRAGERALTMVGTCAPGDGLGLVGHDVVVIDRDTHAAGQTLLDRMLGLGGELVTLLVGAAAPDGLAADLARHIGAEFPGVEVSVYSGGQRGDLIQIGVE
ncbi:DAK2 domain-containing protein [Nocardia carnea]|uniref:DAK2 domain-containing protein n=1 Tax=Nocardia carnea TaxID=37328 RepID=UPI0024548D3B|nr:DAK2 domain-containing protein [Nocardia carnea]